MVIFTRRLAESGLKSLGGSFWHSVSAVREAVPGAVPLSRAKPSNGRPLLEEKRRPRGQAPAFAYDPERPCSLESILVSLYCGDRKGAKSGAQQEPS